MTTHSWRAPARKTALWSTLAALGVLAVTSAIVWTWRNDLPDPLATHWGGRSSVPDDFMSLDLLLFSTALMVVLFCGLFGAIAWFWGATAATRRMVAASTVWTGGLGGALLLLTAGSQRGLQDAHQATVRGWAVTAAIVVPLVPAIAAALLVPGDPHEPAGGPVAADAPRLGLTGDERAVWIRRADGGPGLVVGGIAVVVTTLLAVLLRQWALLVVPVLLVVLFTTMFAFTVRVDATGLTVRSLVGWPGTHVPADEVQRASVTEVNAVRQFGGWGWRLGRGGRVGVVLRSGTGLLVERSGGRSLVVTVDDAVTGAALLNTLADRTRN
ncbi:hypothetical protein Acy02nite_87060 [Actinoplanes cyaneus]|uniref:DUF1648 domain-containing protein n=1 Tax=Actinoplanes cyaneus TaxID=52696 RepID=A0A919IZ87_9ACTN|nr:hypothetical protein [Actinoplanes cyaneus]MCW2143997.1 hypothetical protein [Actinoplanes cyaneus]GID70825.1 hypothetical protein Acy02nite_87060 [Actinoplanes cyaneus]